MGATSVIDYAVTNPATGEVVKEYATATDAEIQAAGPAGRGAAHRA
jgi:succinate-semialdehyde dehydrogenase/glutarate-semialdehyde dehydrogenase